MISKRYIIFGCILLIGVAAIPIILKNSRTIREERAASEDLEKIRCKAFTASGKRCKRKALPGNKFCWQHQN